MVSGNEALNKHKEYHQDSRDRSRSRSPSRRDRNKADNTAKKAGKKDKKDKKDKKKKSKKSKHHKEKEKHSTRPPGAQQAHFIGPIPPDRDPKARLNEGAEPVLLPPASSGVRGRGRIGSAPPPNPSPGSVVLDKAFQHQHDSD